MSDEEPKIVVDDDWKEQVEKEKHAPPVAPSEEPAAAPVEASSDSEPPSPTGEMPPASFEIHLSMLFTQCMASLGQVPDPSGAPPEINKSYAKHFIDTVEMLAEKTQGNLSDEESKMINEILHAMRMAYVNT